jgi:hypothetical protein
MDAQDTDSGQSTGFIAKMFDISFSEFITVDLIRVLYIMLLVLGLMAAILAVLAAFGDSIWTGISMLIFAPLMFIVYAFVSRVWLEVLIVVFRIAEDVRVIAENSRAE